MPFPPPVRWLDRLDRMGAVRFTLTLYVVRWIVLVPVMLLPATVHPQSDTVLTTLERMPSGMLFLALVLLGPAQETLIECTLPYLLLRWLLPTGPNRRHRRSGRPPTAHTRQRPWPFVAASAAAMVLLHPLEPQTIAATAITGSFLAYTYAHFACAGHGLAFLATTCFHAGINLVGFAALATR